MEKAYFRKLVIAGFIKSLTLSFTGLIDCAVVGRFLGADGLSAMKLAVPVFALLSLFSSVFSSGLSVAVSGELSEHGVKRANEVLRSAVTVVCLIGVLLMTVGFLAPNALAELFAGSSCAPTVKAQTADYLRPILIAALPILLYDVLGTAVMIEGGTQALKLSSAVLFVADIAGDLLAVRLNKGMLGIAAASAVAFTAAFAVLLGYFVRGKSMFRPGFSMPERDSLGKMILFGLPVGVKFLCDILRPFSVNRFILSYGTIPGLAALSVQDSVRFVPEALCLGISGATLILTGIFAAESDRSALRQEKMCILRWSLIGGTLAASVMMLLASPLLRIFTSDPDVHSFGVSALRLYLPGVPFIAVNTSVTAIFQGLGDKKRSIVYTLFNRLFTPVLCAWVLGKQFGDRGIYASFAVSEILLTLSMTAALLLRKKRNCPLLPASFLNTDAAADLKIRIRNTDEAVSASQRVNALCLEMGVCPRQAYFLALTAEELAANTLSHGFDPRKDNHLELRVVVTDEQLILRLRDDGRPFDLTERYRMINPEDTTHNIGLRIVFSSADDVSYHSSLNLNNVCVRIRRETEISPSKEG